MSVTGFWCLGLATAVCLVLDTDKAILETAPRVTDDQFTAPGKFDPESQQMDAYWKTHLTNTDAG